MKKLVIGVFVFLMAFVASATEQYNIVFGDKDVNGSLDILADVSSFSFVADFHNIPGNRAVGYYVYQGELKKGQAEQLIAKRQEAEAPVFTKQSDNGQRIELGGLSKNDRVGFYLVGEKGQEGALITGFRFEQTKHGLGLVFDRNGDKGNQGKESTMYIKDAVATPASAPISGQPLPGVLAVLLLAGGGALVAGRKAKKA